MVVVVVMKSIDLQVRQLESRRKIELQLAKEQEQEAALVQELALAEREQPRIAQQLVQVGQEINALTESISSTEEEVRELTGRDAEMQTSIQQLERQLNSLQDPRQVGVPHPCTLGTAQHIHTDNHHTMLT